MSIFSEFIKSVGNIHDLKIEQTLLRFYVEGTVSVVNEDVFDNLKKILAQCNIIGVDIYLSMKNGENDTVFFSSKTIDQLLDRHRTFFDSYSPEDLTRFTFESKDWGERVFVFHKEKLYEHLNSLDITQSLSEFSAKCLSTNKIIIYILEDHPTASNDFFYLVNPLNDFDNNALTSWINNKNCTDKIESRDKVGHFVNAEQYQFIPECFELNDIDNDLTKVFNKLKAIFLLIFLSDYSVIKEDTLFFKIKGYKTLQCKTNGLLDIAVINELSEIYKWVYSDGPFTDKVGIARNVISIHVANEDINTLEIGTCNSAQSGYDLYLKSNVKQYIEVKNKISDMLHSQSDKATSIVKDMFTMFKTSIWTFVAFFMSSILLRSTKIIADSEINFSIFLAGLAFIFLSYGYIVFARKEVDVEKKRLEQKYEEINNRYKDLLNEKDLEKILKQSDVQNKSPMTRELEYIDSKKKFYTISWVFINTVILIVWGLIFIQTITPYFELIFIFICEWIGGIGCFLEQIVVDLLIYGEKIRIYEYV